MRWRVWVPADAATSWFGGGWDQMVCLDTSWYHDTEAGDHMLSIYLVVVILVTPPINMGQMPLPPREIRKSSTSFHVCSWHSFSLLGYTTKADSEAWDPTKARHGNFIVLHVLHCCSQVLSVFNHTQQNRLTASYWNQLRTRTYSVSQTKIIPWGFLKFYFPNGWKFLSKI